MKTKAILLTAAAFTMLMSSTAFAGTWRTGAEPNQDRWWYDNDDGTYAKDGWQWIDGNHDGVAESYYFDADGWMYAATTTPDGYQVNSNGAWVVNGTVQTQTAEATPTKVAETTSTGWFDAAGLAANAQQNVAYDYTTICYDDASLKITGKLTFSNYRTFQSDAIHMAKEGYVWKTVQANIVYTDENASEYGMTYGWFMDDRNIYDTVKEGRFSINFNGKDYNECIFFMDDEFGALTSSVDIECLVPAGYNDIFVAFYDASLVDKINDATGLVDVLKQSRIFFFD